MNTKNFKYHELVKLFREYRPQQIKLLILCSLSTVFYMYFVYLVQDFVDLITSSASMQEIWQMFGHIAVIGLLYLILEIWQNQNWHIFRHTVMNSMRTKMYNKLLVKRAYFFDSHTTGDIVSAIMNDGSSIAESAGISILMLYLNIFKIVLIFAVLLAKNAILGITAIVISLLYFFTVNHVNQKMRGGYKDYAEEYASVNQHLTEDTKAILEIKALNEKDYFSKRFSGHIWNRYMDKVKKMVSIQVQSSAISSLISVIFPVFMVLLGGIYLSSGHITVGTLILFYTYTENLVEPLNNLSDFHRGSQAAIGAAERIYDYLFTEDEGASQDSFVPTETSLSLDIESFAWKDQNILKNIKEEYTGGDRIFIKGESGSGKTTLLKLICGLYDVPNGCIKICGRDVKSLTEDQLFELVKIQFQEPVVLAGTLRENVTLGKIYSENEIMDVLQMVQLDSFAVQNGLDYQILESGKNLSGGQKQRLALARVLIRKPHILILDEATNGLDAETEEVIIQNIQEYVIKNQSILIVTSHKAYLEQICNKTLILS